MKTIPDYASSAHQAPPESRKEHFSPRECEFLNAKKYSAASNLLFTRFIKKREADYDNIFAY